MTDLLHSPASTILITYLGKILWLICRTWGKRIFFDPSTFRYDYKQLGISLNWISDFFIQLILLNFLFPYTLQSKKQFLEVIYHPKSKRSVFGLYSIKIWILVEVASAYDFLQSPVLRSQFINNNIYIIINSYWYQSKHLLTLSCYFQTSINLPQ